MSRYLSIAALICGLLFIAGCGHREDVIVAEVLGEKIRVQEVEEAYTKLPSTDGREVMQVLWALIDRELLNLEAQKRGLEESQRVQEELEKAEADKVLEVHWKRIAEDVVVSEEEMRRYFEEKGLDARTEVRASHIMVKALEEAEDILKALKEGADFARLARERSIDKPSAAKGGDLGYWERGTVIGATARKVFSMKVGETSEPFRSEQGYHIIRVVDERPVGYEKQKPRIEKKLRAMKIREKRKAYAEGLKQKYRLEVNEKTLALLLHTEDAVARASKAAYATKPDNVPHVDVQAHSIPLLTFDGGVLTLGQYLDWAAKLKPRWRPAPEDSAQVVQFAEWIAVGTVLLPRALHEAKLHKTEEVRSYLADKRKELMVEELRRIEVEDKIITDAAIEEYYQAHWQDYFKPETIQVEAMSTETMEEAREALRKIQAGAAMVQVAEVLWSPSDEWRHYKIFQFRSSDEDRKSLGEIVQEAAKTEVGQLGGPTRIWISGRQGQRRVRYAVFRVLNKIPARQRPSEEPSVQADIRKKLRLSEKGEIERQFQNFLLGLRTQYADEIHVYEKNLKFVLLPAQGDRN